MGAAKGETVIQVGSQEGFVVKETACAGLERGLRISVGSRGRKEHSSLAGGAPSYRRASTGFYHFNAASVI